MSKKSKKTPDPFAEIREWQDHMYDPGYYTGGRIHPLLKGRRPNRFGWLLIGSGVLSLLFAGDFLRSFSMGEDWYLAGVSLVEIAAGIALLRKPPAKTARHRGRP